MQIKIKVTGLLTEYFPVGKGILPLHIEKPLTIKEILKLIPLSHELVMTVLVNGQRQDLSYIPPDEAEIVLISPLAGG
ncbi:hypothetical protein Desca_1320 [Desulfotomaculum nigrificans CO-1-SRB]|uniref:ThiamineS protein n=1 Tax=Desulfotomaculum nigrificans (strain DSM 14880 / VKM B-2319 / CO-1-SRB) TaxID=868595 RepID=F6B4R7_DESCC|nr:MoaD/ThiS family protein [Desulfotomaculum nigrificans]AEF94179.1 hypothetical protein Desca_1320 [Desulfotomaculum nigrificans CO-1-SRB]